MPFENVTSVGTFRYCFHLFTPNVFNAIGLVLAKPVDPVSGKGIVPVYKAAADVINYRQFLISKGFYVSIMIEVVAPDQGGDPKDPQSVAAYALHRSFCNLNAQNEADRNLFINQNGYNTNPSKHLPFSDARYVASEDASNILSLPQSTMPHFSRNTEFKY